MAIKEIKGHAVEDGFIKNKATLVTEEINGKTFDAQSGQEIWFKDGVWTNGAWEFAPDEKAGRS